MLHQALQIAIKGVRQLAEVFPVKSCHTVSQGQCSILELADSFHQSPASVFQRLASRIGLVPSVRRPKPGRFPQ